MLVFDAIQEFLLACRADGLSPKTLVWYTSILKTFSEAMEGRELASVQTSEVRQHLVNLRDRKWKYGDGRRQQKRGGLTPETINAHGRVLHRFWKWTAIEYDLKNPMANIKYPPQPKPKEPKAVAMDDVLRLFQACGKDAIGRRNRAVIAFLLDTGCRAGGVTGLKVRDVDLSNRRAYVIEKGDKQRPVVFTPVTTLLLEDWLKIHSGSEYLFYNMTYKTRLTTSGLEQVLIRLKRKAQITGRVNPHAFRHGFAREYLRNGGNLAALAQLMGHDDPSLTARLYAIFAQDELAEEHLKYSPMAKIKMSPRKEDI